MNDNHSQSENEISITIIEEPQAASAPHQAPSPGEITISVNDRRQYMARIPVEIDLHLTAPEKQGMARSVDISVTGLLVQTLLGLQLDERVIVTVLHPDEETHVCAKVARLAGNDPNGGNKYGLIILSDDIGIWQGVLRRLIL